LKNYDGMWFISTVGELPFPDRDAFFKWVADGHAVMGNHGASDSMHQTPEWAKMLGGEFQNHNSQAVGMIRNFDPNHPATAKWGSVIPIHEELYMFFKAKAGNRNPYVFDRSVVHSLLSMTETPPDGQPNPGSPGWFPVAWTKMYGNGRMFFTSLGHREDVVDPAWTDGNGQRQNSPEVALAVQDHFLGGIRWALGLAEGDTKPQAIKP
jgi:type 1 glutamine amidotransferase